MAHLLRFVGFVAAGSVGGLALGETLGGKDSPEGWSLMFALLGAYIGIGAEMGIRILIRRKWKFSVQEALVAMTMLVVLLATFQVLSTAYRGN